MRIAIRVDASQAIGLGHLKRCMSLIRPLQEAGAEIVLVVLQHDVDMRLLVGSSDNRIIFLPGSPIAGQVAATPGALSWMAASIDYDAFSTVDVLSAWEPELIIVDHYGIDARWHNVVRARLGAKIVVIDDLADRPLEPDVLIDHNFATSHAEKYKGRIPSTTKVLGGPRFGLLGPSYAEAPRYKFDSTVRSVGIFMGGTDPINATRTVLTACREIAGFSGMVEVASTSANPRLTELREACRRWPNTNLTLDQDDLSAFFARHDLQIGAGGGATLERCCMGVPTLALICAANQAIVVPVLHQLGVVETAPSLDEHSIGDAILRLIDDPVKRKHLADRSRSLVDGLGAKRVAIALLSDSLRVRPAELEDADLIFGWRNDVATRQTARDSGEIAWEDHISWLKRVLSDRGRRLLIGAIGATPVGVIRFDLEGVEAEVSLYLDPALHSLGLGKRLLLAGETDAAVYWPQLRFITAMSLEHNAGSQFLFKSAGYAGDYRRFHKQMVTARTH